MGRGSLAFMTEILIPTKSQKWDTSFIIYLELPRSKYIYITVANILRHIFKEEYNKDQNKQWSLSSEKAKIHPLLLIFSERMWITPIEQNVSGE